MTATLAEAGLSMHGKFARRIRNRNYINRRTLDKIVEKHVCILYRYPEDSWQIHCAFQPDMGAGYSNCVDVDLSDVMWCVMLVREDGHDRGCIDKD